VPKTTFDGPAKRISFYHLPLIGQTGQEIKQWLFGSLFGVFKNNEGEAIATHLDVFGHSAASISVKCGHSLEFDIPGFLEIIFRLCLQSSLSSLTLHDQEKIEAVHVLHYQLKGQFDENTIFETDTKISNDQSLFAGIIRITAENLDYVVDRFDDLPIAFGLLSPQGKSPYKINRTDFLEEIVSKGLKPEKIYWKN
jgi:hypothetical protein